MRSLWGLFLVFLMLGLFGVNLVGMIVYSYQTMNAPQHNLMYLFLAIWSTYCCYYISSVLADVWTTAKKMVDDSKK